MKDRCVHTYMHTYMHVCMSLRKCFPGALLWVLISSMLPCGSRPGAVYLLKP